MGCHSSKDEKVIEKSASQTRTGPGGVASSAINVEPSRQNVGLDSSSKPGAISDASNGFNNKENSISSNHGKSSPGRDRTSKLSLKQERSHGGAGKSGSSSGFGGAFSVSSKMSALSSERNGLQYVAKYSYQARTPEDLTFQAGDKLTITNTTGQWWTAVNQRNQQGYVPSNFVAPLDSIESQLWYHGDVRRREAENMLRMAEVGTFMVRDSESKPGEYSLSLRDTTLVKHYRVRASGDGDYHITRHVVFNSLQHLIAHYSQNADGLCCQLRYVCPRKAQNVLELDYRTTQNWEVSRDNIQLVRVLGKGEFGTVWYGKWNETTEVAVKILKQGSANKVDFLKEATVMKKLQHDKLIRLYAVVTASEPFMLVTEYMECGSLLNLLRNNPAFGVSELVDMASQVAEGMAYLEENNFIHRDLAARNVLVAKDNVCKVADFGLARAINPQVQLDYNPRAGAKFPVKWTAPEAALYSSFSIKSDVWSFGVLLYEMMTGGSNPYPGMSNTQVLEEVSKGHRMSCPERCPDYVYSVMWDCWRAKPEDRPTFDSLASKLSDMVVNPNNYTETVNAQ